MYDRDSQIKVTVLASELRKLFWEAAEEHGSRAHEYRLQAGQLGTSEKLDSDNEGSYGASIAQNVQNAKKSLLDKAREHETSATIKKFISAHLAEGEHTFNAGQIRDWGLFF